MEQPEQEREKPAIRKIRLHFPEQKNDLTEGHWCTLKPQYSSVTFIAK